MNEPIGALAHLEIGRAYAMQGDTAKARAAYQDFLTLWKEKLGVVVNYVERGVIGYRDFGEPVFQSLGIEPYGAALPLSA